MPIRFCRTTSWSRCCARKASTSPAAPWQNIARPWESGLPFNAGGRNCWLLPRRPDYLGEIGSTSCRERVCQYVYISVLSVSLTQKSNTKTQHKEKNHNKQN